MYHFTSVDPDSQKRAKSLLSDLGKSTMRGVRKCPKCGTYNGTRGLSCKNKACDVVFKEAGVKKKSSVDVCKLDTGTSTRVYSVRVKDKGPDTRGFVQLPFLEPDLPSDSVAYLSSVSAVCFVESCQRLFNTNLLKCHERQLMPSSSTCSHILSAMRCCVEATPLQIDYDVLQSLRCYNSTKEEIWRLTNEVPGPLVQRVSKNVMVVRTEVTTKDPLGFLHVSFFGASLRLKEHPYVCSCSPVQPLTKKTEKKTSLCVHYYACIAAFASDSKCSEEFANLIMSESNCSLIARQHGMEELDVEEPLVAILSSDTVQDAVEVEVLHKDLMLTDIGVQDFGSLTPVVELNDDALNDQSLDIIMTQPAQAKKAKKRILKNRKLLTSRTMSSARRKAFNKDMRTELGFSEGKYRNNINAETTDASKVSMSFIEWLASVTERINQTMHYGFSGKPEPLVFHAPHAFFECLLERLMIASNGNKKKRLPDLVTTFTRKDALPVGMFNSYTWHICNILHAKSVFDTPLMQLNVSRSFTMTTDGRFVDTEAEDNIIQVPRRQGELPLKPVDYKTYLKIGHTSPDQSSPSVLKIDWTPNVLPLSRIGELKITFEYGHTQVGTQDTKK